MVPLYGGALPQRYRTKVWSDVRLVMAPEMQAANFGGDDDNFNYPRFAFDFALLRVYEADGRPHRPRHWLRPARTAVRDGDALMVPGHPYRTERGLSVAQLETLRDAITEVVACFPVYRTYVDRNGWRPEDRTVVERAIARARWRNPAMERSLFDFFREVVLPRDMEVAQAKNLRAVQQNDPGAVVCATR